MKKNIFVVLAFVLAAKASFAENEGLFDGHLSLVEIVRSTPYAASADDGYVVPEKPRVHNLIGRVIEVYDGSISLRGSETRGSETLPTRICLKFSAGMRWFSGSSRNPRQNGRI